MLAIFAQQSTALSFGAKAAPKAKGFSPTSLPGNFNALGGGEVVPGGVWDPAGFTKGKSELEVNRYREAELTHGRVGMLASLGFLVQEKFRKHRAASDAQTAPRTLLLCPSVHLN